MAPDFTLDWRTAVREYLLHLQAHRAKTTVSFYDCQLRQLVHWTEDENVSLQSFGKRHLDRYLNFRSQTVSRTTMRHDAVCAKAFLKWCVRNDFLERNPLTDYAINTPPRTAMYMPTEDDVASLLKAAQNFWNVRLNPNVKYHSPARRVFHRERNYAVLLLLLDSACRIGEALSLSVEDYRPSERQITIRESKGKQPRLLPLSPPCIAAINEWLKIRQRLMKEQMEDEGFLFISEFGTPLETRRFLKTMKLYRALAELLLSPDALLAALKKAVAPPVQTPRVLGVDDFAFRRGHTYGTILVDLEKRCSVDMLPDREASSVEAWLNAHPGVEIISRDRGKFYREGATRGAPNAVQIADRWYLMKNLGDALEKFLARKHKSITEALTPEKPITSIGSAIQINHRCPVRRQRRVEVYEQVVALYQNGIKISGISRQTGLCRHTIRTDMTSDGFPERRARTTHAGKLAPFAEYLRRRFSEGGHNATELHKEISKRGYTGQYTMVKAFVASLRTPEPVSTSAEKHEAKKRRALFSPRRLSWVLTNQHSAKVSESDRLVVEFLAKTCPEIGSAATLGTQFCALVRERKAEAFPVWLEAAWQSGVAELRTFAAGLRSDRAAVEAALSCEWSNGQVEGQVNRLKFVKRQMYGRAGFTLLRARVLPNATVLTA